MLPMPDSTTPLVNYADITPAKRAANRANALKSTGPRTAAGKRHSSMNAWRHGWRTEVTPSCIPDRGREAAAYARFKRALRVAVLPVEGEKGEQVLLKIAAATWKVKRNYERWLATRTDDEFFLMDTGVAPRPAGWRLKLRRTDGWWVTISVRRNRAPGSARMLPYLDPELTGVEGCRAWAGEPRVLDRPRQHVMVKLSCVRHPWFAEAGSRAVDMSGMEVVPQTAPDSTPESTNPPSPQASGDCPASPELNTASQVANHERSHDLDDAQRLAKISRRGRRRPVFERGEHGMGRPRPRRAPDLDEDEEREMPEPSWWGMDPPGDPWPDNLWRHAGRAAGGQDPLDAGDEAATGFDEVTNEATRLKKTNGFQKYLEGGFWQSLSRRTLTLLGSQLFGSGESG